MGKIERLSNRQGNEAPQADEIRHGGPHENQPRGAGTVVGPNESLGDDINSGAGSDSARQAALSGTEIRVPVDR